MSPINVAVRERPILFSDAMVRAICAGRKTQTRRVVKVPSPKHGGWMEVIPVDLPDGTRIYMAEERGEGGHRPMRWTEDAGVLTCPYGAPGDRLAVKEAAWVWCERVPNGTTPTGRPKVRYLPVGQHVVYCADADRPAARIDDDPTHDWRWKAARFLPAWAVRTRLEVASVRVEQVQDISEGDALAEGCPGEFCRPCDESGLIDGEYCEDCSGEGRHPCSVVFRRLWESINTDRGYGWDANPRVWVIDFRRVDDAEAPHGA